MPNLRFEKAFWDGGAKVVAGVDEVGRGALAGPVTAAAVVLPRYPSATLLRTVDDSKRLSPKQRQSACELVLNEALHAEVASVDAAQIDEWGIVRSTMAAMLAALRTIAGLDAVLTDALSLPLGTIPQKPLVKGDQLSLSIAAASVVAKVRRDELMCRMDETYPAYGFGRHKGYGTAAHLARLRHNGPCALHRRSFAPVRDVCRQFSSGAH